MEISDKYNEIQILLNNINKYCDDILDIDQACEYLGFKKRYLYLLTKQKSLPFHKPWGKKIFFSRKELNEWITGKHSQKSGDNNNE